MAQSQFMGVPVHAMQQGGHAMVPTGSMQGIPQALQQQMLAGGPMPNMSPGMGMAMNVHPMSMAGHQGIPQMGPPNGMTMGHMQQLTPTQQMNAQRMLAARANQMRGPNGMPMMGQMGVHPGVRPVNMAHMGGQMPPNAANNHAMLVRTQEGQMALAQQQNEAMLRQAAMQAHNGGMPPGQIRTAQINPALQNPQAGQPPAQPTPGAGHPPQLTPQQQAHLAAQAHQAQQIQQAQAAAHARQAQEIQAQAAAAAQAQQQVSRPGTTGRQPTPSAQLMKHNPSNQPAQPPSVTSAPQNPNGPQIKAPSPTGPRSTPQPSEMAVSQSAPGSGPGQQPQPATSTQQVNLLRQRHAQQQRMAAMAHQQQLLLQQQQALLEPTITPTTQVLTFIDELSQCNSSELRPWQMLVNKFFAPNSVYKMTLSDETENGTTLHELSSNTLPFVFQRHYQCGLQKTTYSLSEISESPVPQLNLSLVDIKSCSIYYVYSNGYCVILHGSLSVLVSFSGRLLEWEFKNTREHDEYILRDKLTQTPDSPVELKASPTLTKKSGSKTPQVTNKKLPGPLERAKRALEKMLKDKPVGVQGVPKDVLNTLEVASIMTSLGPVMLEMQNSPEGSPRRPMDAMMECLARLRAEMAANGGPPTNDGLAFDGANPLENAAASMVPNPGGGPAQPMGPGQGLRMGNVLLQGVNGMNPMAMGQRTPGPNPGNAQETVNVNGVPMTQNNSAASSAGQQPDKGPGANPNGPGFMMNGPGPVNPAPNMMNPMMGNMNMNMLPMNMVPNGGQVPLNMNPNFGGMPMNVGMNPMLAGGMPMNMMTHHGHPQMNVNMMGVNPMLMNSNTANGNGANGTAGAGSPPAAATPGKRRRASVAGKDDDGAAGAGGAAGAAGAAKKTSPKGNGKRVKGN